MRTRTLRVLLPAAAALLCASLLPAQSLTVYFTASLRGNLDGCNCEHNRVAGLVKRAAFQRTVPREALVLDAGDILDATRDPDLTREILAVYRELGYAAVGVGETELSEGAQALAANARRFPFLAHNLSVRSPSGRWTALSAKPLLLTRAGIRIGLLGISEPKMFEGQQDFKEGNLRFDDPVQSAAHLAAESRKLGAQLVIVLFHGTDDTARRLAVAAPEVDLVLFGHAGWLVPPEKVGRALVASPGENGNRIWVLTLRLGPEGITGFEHRLLVFAYDKDPDDPSVRERVRAYRKKLQERLRRETS
jgi:2',3'-cyclic-nucleotide 2'-phosphodiesterase (5'-nucleotidase family)